jgi:hypothetical protein
MWPRWVLPIILTQGDVSQACTGKTGGSEDFCVPHVPSDILSPPFKEFPAS